MRIRKTIFTPFLLTFFIVSFIYLFLAFQINKNIFYPTDLSYFNFLIQAFQNHQLNIITPSTLDLSFYQGKWYMYWGPAPALFILPFYLIWGISTSDIFYTLLAGIFNILIFYLLIKEFIKYFNLSISPLKQQLVILSFAFASPNLYLSLNGRVWHTSQIISVLYLLIFYLFYFKFLNNLNKLYLFILAVIFVNLAWFSRYTLIFNLILLTYPLGILLKKQHFSRFKITLLAALLITVLTGSIMLMYNQARFNNPFETGILHVFHNPRYVRDLETKGIFSLAYVKHNLTYYFFSLPQFSLNPLRLHISYEGNSVFIIYPFLFFILPLMGRKIRIYTKKRFFQLSTVVLLLNIGALMMLFCTGWVQFGNRYFFDVIPLLFLFTLFVIQKIRLPILIIIFFYGLIINLLGTFDFYT